MSFSEVTIVPYENIANSGIEQEAQNKRVLFLFFSWYM